ncbi:MAG: hypothetical protein ISS59_01460 [Desulfobacteraceae bacterium]|nr:hypothetical protein [Desulfobacteraceae bacterium]
MKSEAEVKIKKKSNFSNTQQEKAARCNLLVFQKNSGATIIGILASGVLPGFKH